MVRNILRPESDENEFENSSNLSMYSPSRDPLNSIPDPSQVQKLNHGSDDDLTQKVEGAKAQQHRPLDLEKRTVVSAMYGSTSRNVSRSTKTRSEPNSAQCTPARSGARVSLAGGVRVVQSIGGRGLSSLSRIPRAFSVADSAKVAHSELNQDPSFWREHNAQAETMSIRSDFHEDTHEKETMEESKNSIDTDGASLSNPSDVREELKESMSLSTINTEIECFHGSEIDKHTLQIKLEKLTKELEEARYLISHYEKEHKLKLSQEREIELVHEQVETETTRTILHLQEEVIALQSDFQERICNLTRENQSLKDTIAAREAEIKALNQGWERATIELTSFIADGSKSIRDASTQIESIICSFPHVNVWIGGHVEKAAKACLEKEETVLLLQRSLEDARILIGEMNLKLTSLKEASIVLNEVRLQDDVATKEEVLCPISTGKDNTNSIADSPNIEFESKHHQILPAERHGEREMECTFSTTPCSEEYEGLVRRMDPARSFFKQFEAINATMKEADLALRQLVEANNEKPQHVTGMWCLTGEEDLEHCRSSASLCGKEDQILMSLVEESFVQMKKGVEESLEMLHSNVLLVGKELLHLIEHSRPLLEQMASDTMEKGFSQHVIYQCYIGKLVDQILEQSTSFENLSLKKELERKDALFEGLLFDFRLLQESASSRRDVKDETDELIDELCQVQQQLGCKTIQVEDIKTRLNDLQKAFFTSNSNLEQANERIHTLMEQNNALSVLVDDLGVKKTAAEEELEEQKELVKGLEKEIIHLTTAAEKQVHLCVRTVEDNLRKISDEKDQLVEEITCFTDKLEMAYAIAEEKEAIAIEARQESEASKIYAEQKEEEVKILEKSVEELEYTVNVLEKRVYDVDEEVERHRTIRDSLETELQALRQRLSRVECFNNIDSERPNEAHEPIHSLEMEIAELKKEIKQLREYNSEVVLHSEAQASSYQEKYKAFEAMVQDFKIDSSNSSTAAASHKREKSSTRSRGSGSPFRCIAGMVQQMNLERDQELTTARLRIEELESLLAAKQKEVCSLNTRIAAAESMTHDVIRDLLGVKMDLNNYANFVDDYQIQRLVEEGQQHAERIQSKEQEIVKLKKHIGALAEERESCVSELNRKGAEVVVTQITVEQLQERAQLLCVQNDMLKSDKTNLLRRVAELDQIINTLDHPHSSSHRLSQAPKMKQDTMSIKLIDTDYSKRLQNAQKLLSHANGELAKYRRSSNNQPQPGVTSHGFSLHDYCI